MAFIEPLAGETWFVSVLAGTPDIFLGIALMVIFGFAGFFRMPMLIAFFMLISFLLMFSSYVASPILILMFIVGGLLIGFSLSKVFAT